MQVSIAGIISLLWPKTMLRVERLNQDSKVADQKTKTLSWETQLQRAEENCWVIIVCGLVRVCLLMGTWHLHEILCCYVSTWLGIITKTTWGTDQFVIFLCYSSCHHALRWLIIIISTQTCLNGSQPTFSPVCSYIYMCASHYLSAEIQSVWPASSFCQCSAE